MICYILIIILIIIEFYCANILDKEFPNISQYKCAIIVGIMIVCCGGIGMLVEYCILCGLG